MVVFFEIVLFFFADVFSLSILWIVVYRSIVCTCLILIECIAITVLTCSLVTVVSIEIVAMVLCLCFVAIKARVLSMTTVVSNVVTTFSALLFLHCRT